MAIRFASPVSAARGPGGWLFPLALLDDVRYVDEARVFVTSLPEDIPVTDACMHGQR